MLSSTNLKKRETFLYIEIEAKGATTLGSIDVVETGGNDVAGTLSGTTCICLLLVLFFSIRLSITTPPTTITLATSPPGDLKSGFFLPTPPPDDVDGATDFAVILTLDDYFYLESFSLNLFSNWKREEACDG